MILTHVEIEERVWVSNDCSWRSRGSCDRSKLAQNNVSVILAPARCVPDNWNTRRCREDNMQILRQLE